MIKSVKRFLATEYYKIRDNKDLNSIPKKSASADNLIKQGNISLSEIFSDPEIEKMWRESEEKLKQFKFPVDSGGVNQGDRKAIYYLISKFKPQSILEVGTHVGASTVHIASALQQNEAKHNVAGKMTTVDIFDVNDEKDKRWQKFGTEYSALQMLQKLGLTSYVEFVKDDSVNFSDNTDKKFDFIFLDGSHDARIVYNEVPAALKLLKPGGVILLHDYFPRMKPLWKSGGVLPGPYLAVNRLIKEGMNAVVIPLGDLPWETKLNSNTTSLALLVKKD